MKKFRIYECAVFLALVLLQGCATLGYPDVDTIEEGIVVATAELRGANALLQDLIRRNAIGRTDAERAVDAIQEAKDQLQAAADAVEISGDPFTADSKLQAANQAITLALVLLSSYVEEPT